jgi:hypothetical protein
MSAPGCAACAHPERERIDAALAFGWSSVRKLGARYGLSKDQVWEHGRKHLTPALREAILTHELVHDERPSCSLGMGSPERRIWTERDEREVREITARRLHPAALSLAGPR